jgi:hypothetical protein
MIRKNLERKCGKGRGVMVEYGLCSVVSERGEKKRGSV